MDDLRRRTMSAPWDRWLPLAVVALFILLGALVLVLDVNAGVPAGDLERFHILYTEIGIQTTAGIFAIIISLSLVAIQFAAQEYSHRIMEYYLKSTVFWTTMIAYLVIIVAGIVLQARATPDDDVRAAVVLLIGVFLGLTLLIPHFLITAAYLKPEFVVQKLMNGLNDRYARSLMNKGLPQPDSDRLLPVIEIIERSIDRGDVTTMRGAVAQIVHAHQRWNASRVSDTIDEYFVSAMLRIGRKAVAQPEEQQAAVLAMAGLEAIRTERNTPAVVDAFEELGFAALRRDSEVAVAEMIKHIAAASDSSTDPEIHARTLSTFTELSHRLVSANHRRLLLQLTASIAESGDLAAVHENPQRLMRTVELLEEIGHDTAAAHMSAVVKAVVLGLQRLAASDFGSSVGGHAIDLALLRIEQTVPRSERSLLATIAFARSQNPGTRGYHHVPSAEPQESDDPLGLAELWNESKNE